MKTRSWFRIHSFIGVVTGLLLFVICWSGTFAVIANELDWLVTPALRAAPQTSQATWGQIKAAAEAAYPGARVGSITAPLYRYSAAVVRIERADGGREYLSVDPYTGIITGTSSGFTVQRFFRDFHRRLFYPGPWGHYLVCLFALTMLASLIAALSFYKRWWRRFLRFKKGRGRVFWSEMHKTAGLWSLWFVLVIALTGVWYVFEAARADFGDGKSVFARAADSTFVVHSIPSPELDPERAELPLDALLEQVKRVRPDFDIRQIRYAENGVVEVMGQAGHLLVRDRANKVLLNVQTGAVIYNQNAAELPLYWRWSDTADPLHFGDFGGLTSKLIWFAFGLILCGLILTGTYLHAHRLAREAPSRARHRWPGTRAAIMVSLIVLAASAPFGLRLARDAYGPMVDGVQRLPDLAFGVTAVIVGWVTLTLIIIVAWVLMLQRSRIVLGTAGPQRTRRRSRRAVNC